MRNLLIIVGIGALGFAGWYYVQHSKAGAQARRSAAAEETRRVTAPAPARVTIEANAGPPPAYVRAPANVEPAAAARPSGNTALRCDGRTYCSQMASCQEAQWFLAHCPDVKMDGDGDGVPCEQQWCGGG